MDSPLRRLFGRPSSGSALLGPDLGAAAARLGVPVEEFEAALDAVGGGGDRARPRTAGRRHCATDALAAEMGVTRPKLTSALGAAATGRGMRPSAAG